MLVVGLTGGIGSGKSTVADLFAKHGVPILDADDIAKELTLPATNAYHAILDHFGEDYCQTDGTLNRRKLRELIFSNQSERAWLEALLHPAIQASIESRLKSIQTAYVIIVVPLLAESPDYPFIDRILVVDTTYDHQLARVSRRDRVDESQVKAILLTQASREMRLACADDIVQNDGNLDHLQAQVALLHKKYSDLTTFSPKE